MQGGFWRGLFDFSFREMITPRIITVLYWIAIIVSGLFTVFYMVAGIMQGTAQGLLALVISPLVGLLCVIVSRVYLEVVIVLFRILGALERGAPGGGAGVSPPPPPPPTSGWNQPS